ncbi:MAG: hypothetical protein LBJ23_08665 [Tannerella sp.]|jgi:hypothetical protein|nr:hypothetical protein [Tannerella sp.]
MKKIIGLLALLVLTGCSGTGNKGTVCKNSVFYGYVNICLPEIRGMQECLAHENVKQIVQPYLISGPVLGYYLNNETYGKIDSLGLITYDTYFMLYGEYQYENYQAAVNDLETKTAGLEKSLFDREGFEQIEKNMGAVKAEKPVLLEKYSPYPNVRTMIVLMKYKSDEGTETSVVSAANVILVKQRLLNLAYYVAYSGGKSIDDLKQKNETVVSTFLKAN